jgi:UDP-glucose 4-epimerase
MYKEKRLLITGGTGSFGNAVLRRAIELGFEEIRIFSRDEKKQDEMRKLVKAAPVSFFLGDVRDRDSISRAMRGVDYVFHAAALKQVPSCEFFPMEAVKTNILGADSVMATAETWGVERVVVLSTDKAVYPINAMGISKAMMERAMIARARESGLDGQTKFCVTRYGNVMASRGSVIPLFIDQIKSKKEITITNPAMTRFLMSLDDSVDLVLHAFSNGHQGDLFVQKAPAATIIDLADALIQIFDSKVEIKYVGTRHGEKLYESLLSREEKGKCFEDKRYFRVPMDARNLNYDKYISAGSEKNESETDYTSHNTERLDVEGVKKLLLNLDYVKRELNA